MQERSLQILDKLGFNLLLLGKVLLIIVAAFILERIIRLLLQRSFSRNRDMDSSDLTGYRFMRNAVRFLVSLVALGAIIYSIPSVKHVAITMFAGAGILVAILGLATQRAFSNIISGIFIVGFKPFRVGDIVEVLGHRGMIEDITLRHTVIVSFENRRVIIPNSMISEDVIVNSTIEDPTTCEFVEIGVSYESDLDKAMRILSEEAEAHPHSLDKRSPAELAANEDRVMVRLVQIADSALLLRAYVWAKDPITARLMHFDLNRSVKLRFDREGIEIPYPHRTIVHKEGAKASLAE